MTQDAPCDRSVFDQREQPKPSTAQRPTECSHLEWREISGSWWSIPGRRTKNGRTHRVFLTPFALEALHGVPRVEGERFAFTGRRGKRQLAEANMTAFDGVRRREKPRHALRHTAATNMAKLVSKSDRAKVLNYADDSGPAATGEYDDYEYDKEKRLALTKWAHGRPRPARDHSRCDDEAWMC